MSSASSGGSRASQSPRQSISHSSQSHGGSPHIPASSIPAFLKDQFVNLAHGSGSSADNSYSYGHSLPIVPTLNSFVTSPPSSAASTTQMASVPSTSRLPGAETMGGKSTPALSLTVPSPTTGLNSPAMSIANHSHSALNASPVVEHAGSFRRAFPPTESTFPDKYSADGVFLTRSLIEYVFSAYDTKLLKSSPEVRRAVRKEQKANRDKKNSVSYARDDDGTGKDGLSSIAGLSSVAPHSHLLSGSSLPLASGFKTGLTGTLASTLTGGNAPSGAASILMPISDLEDFIELIIGGISYRRTREEKREKKEKKERDKLKVKEEKEERRERERKEADDLSSSSLSDGIDFSKAAKKVKAKVKGRSVDKLRDSKGDERESVDSVKEHKKRKDKDNVGGVGGLVLGLWTGRVNLVVKLREKTEERDREREKANRFADARQVAERDGVLSDGLSSWRNSPSNPSKDSKHRPSIWSDGDTDSHSYANDSTKAGKRISLPAGDKHSPPTLGRRSSVSAAHSRSRYGSVHSVAISDKPDERSTEEEGPGILGSETLGALWAKSGSKVKGKLENWAG
ncbi:hypothetical protein F5050DRAFT_1494043 [Lentinula boryana]|uniref:Uncharacterized protein n=1 Tax=Lentinula boryana TaxID=40481 RepID=A0ABQ8QF46_9AGAR|nr:hypothetical protein F5050DRAFT_1494043 [Lentinula boryana]